MKSSKYLGSTLAVARGLGAMYSNLGASSYQQVRNPFPMRELVKSVLPSMSAPPPDIQPWEEGFTHGNTINALKRWKSKARTVEQIMADLRARGFIVNKPGVIMALCNTNGIVARRDRAYRLTKRGARFVAIARYAKAK